MSNDNESPIILTAAEQEGFDMPDDFGDEIITSDSEGHDDFAMDDEDGEIEVTIDEKTKHHKHLSLHLSLHLSQL